MGSWPESLQQPWKDSLYILTAQQSHQGKNVARQSTQLKGGVMNNWTLRWMKEPGDKARKYPLP